MPVRKGKNHFWQERDRERGEQASSKKRGALDHAGRSLLSGKKGRRATRKGSMDKGKEKGRY